MIELTFKYIKTTIISIAHFVSTEIHKMIIILCTYWSCNVVEEY